MMFENRHEREPYPGSDQAREEDWNILIPAAELLTSIGEYYVVNERTISGTDSRLVAKEEIREGVPNILVLSAFRGSLVEPVVEFAFNELGEPEEMPEIPQPDRLDVATDIEHIFRDVSEALEAAQRQGDQPLLVHLQNYAAYLRDDCVMGDNDVWLGANKGFPVRLKDAVARKDSRITLKQRDYRSSSDVPEQLDVMQSILRFGDRTRYSERPRLEIYRYTPDGDEIMSLVIAQDGRVDIVSNSNRVDPYELTQSGLLTRYGAQRIIAILFEHMSIDLSHEPDPDNS